MVKPRTRLLIKYQRWETTQDVTIYAVKLSLMIKHGPQHSPLSLITPASCDLLPPPPPNHWSSAPWRKVVRWFRGGCTKIVRCQIAECQRATEQSTHPGEGGGGWGGGGCAAAWAGPCGWWSSSGVCLQGGSPPTPHTPLIHADVYRVMWHVVSSGRGCFFNFPRQVQTC